MKMNSIAKTALKDIVAAAVGLLPGGNILEGAAVEAADIAISALCKQDQDAIQVVTTEIFDTLTTRPDSLSPHDPGRAVSAAYNVLDTVRRSRLDADRIIDCGLDPSQVYDYLLKFPAVGIEAASGGRQMIYHSYLRAFAEKVTDAVFPTAPFQRRLYQRLLRNQEKMMKMIEQQRGGDADKPLASR